MKKFTYGIMGLSVAGAALSGLLFFQNYNPNAAISRVFCGSGLYNSCLALSQSDYSSLFGIPIAAYGVLFYLLILFIFLIADYAEERYHAYSLAVLLPLSIAGVLADIVLAGILIKLKLACPLCIATYAVNLGILFLSVAWFRMEKKQPDWSLPAVYREIFMLKKAPSDRRAFYAAFVLFVFLLPFAIFSTSHIVQQKSNPDKLSIKQVEAEVQSFYQQPVEKIEFPDNGILLGNPGARLTITVFTDFLCSFCYKFYLVEEILLSKYRDQIKIQYFNYPLDQSCNPNMKRTMYPNSCIASRAFVAASETGVLEPYIIRHFADYNSLAHSYDRYRSLAVLGGMGQDARKRVNAVHFQEIMNSEKTTALLDEHIKLAKKLGIDGTPAVFIGNRRIIGYRPVEIMDAIIKKELAGK